MVNRKKQRIKSLCDNKLMLSWAPENIILAGDEVGGYMLKVERIDQRESP